VGGEWGTNGEERTRTGVSSHRDRKQFKEGVLKRNVERSEERSRVYKERIARGTEARIGGSFLGGSIVQAKNVTLKGKAE